MPLIVRVLAEDLDYWRLENHTARFYHYRPAIDDETSERVQLVSPEPLVKLVGQDMICFIGKQESWLSRKTGQSKEVKITLKRPTAPIRDSRRVRLRSRIKRQPKGGLKVVLEDLDVPGTNVPDSQT